MKRPATPSPASGPQGRFTAPSGGDPRAHSRRRILRFDRRRWACRDVLPRRRIECARRSGRRSSSSTGGAPTTRAGMRSTSPNTIGAVSCAGPLDRWCTRTSRIRPKDGSGRGSSCASSPRDAGTRIPWAAIGRTSWTIVSPRSPEGAPSSSWWPDAVRWAWDRRTLPSPRGNARPGKAGRGSLAPSSATTERVGRTSAERDPGLVLRSGPPRKPRGRRSTPGRPSRAPRAA